MQEIKRRCDFNTNTIINQGEKKKKITGVYGVYANPEEAKSIYLHTDRLKIRG